MPKVSCLPNTHTLITVSCCQDEQHVAGRGPHCQAVKMNLVLPTQVNEAMTI